MLVMALPALALVACGDDNEVGSGIDVDEGVEETCRLGECTTTTAAAPSVTEAPATTTTTAPRATTTTNRVTTTTAVQPSLVIRIQGDKAQGGAFDPGQAAVSKGGIVRWTNTDAVARAVEADAGAFRSPSIPPGGSWDYKASASGTFNYHDVTRPYAIGSLEVV